MPHVFQTEFPKAEAQTIATAILSRQFHAALIRDAWVVAEYGVDLAIPAGTFGATGPEVSEATALEALQAAASAEGSGAELAQALPPLPWIEILKAILTAILSVL